MLNPTARRPEFTLSPSGPAAGIHARQLGYPIANDPNYGPRDCGEARPFPTVGDPAPDETEAHLRCCGIWLHAKRYTGPTFDFEADDPPWAAV